MIKNLVVLALAGFVFTGCASSHCGSCKLVKWDYKIVNGPDFNLQAEFNQLGKDGWKLNKIVNFTDSNSNPRQQYIFERRIQ